MDRELSIKLRLDKAPAAAASAQFHAEERKRIADLVTETRAAEEKKAGYARDALGRFVAGQREAGQVARRSVEEVTQSWGEMNLSVGGVARSLTSFAGQMVGLSTVTGGVNLIAQSFQKARDLILESSRFLTDYRDKVLELSALKGQLGQSTAGTRESLAFRAQTFQTAEAANRFQLAALGVGESAIDTATQRRNMTRTEYERGLTLAGSFQAAEHGDAEAHGVLYGITPALMAGATRRRVTGEEAFAREMQYYKIMQPGGFTFSSGAQQLSKLAPLVSSGLYDDRQVAALLSAFSTTNKEGAGEMVQQFTRATLGGIGRTGAPRMEDAGKWNDYLKGLGIDKAFLGRTKGTELPFEIANRISADLERRQREGEATGVEFNPMLHLRQAGMMNAEDVNTLLAYHGLRTSGRLETFMGLAGPGAAPDVSGQIADIGRAQRTDPALRQQGLEVGTAMSKTAAGAPVEYYRQLMQRAYDRMVAREPGAWGSFEDYLNDPRLGGSVRLEKEAASLLEEEFKRTGGVPEIHKRTGLPEVDAAAYTPYQYLTESHMGLWSVAGTGDRAARFQEVAEMLGRQGGNVLPGLGGLQGEADKQLGALDRFETAIGKLDAAAEKLKGPVVPPPLPPGRPPVMPGRVGD